MSHVDVIMSKEGRRMLENVRTIVKKLPEVEEVIDGFGHTVIRVRNKSFIFLGGSLESGPVISIKATKEMQQFLIGQQQGTFWKTPYIGQHGWVSTYAAAPDSWIELEPLIVEGYCLAAPKSLVKEVRTMYEQ